MPVPATATDWQFSGRIVTQTAKDVVVNLSGGARRQPVAGPGGSNDVKLVSGDHVTMDEA